MDRRAAFVLLAVFGAGVFLAGLELMVTAVALPSILGNLAGATSATAWVELRKASWIINGYLLVYILVMPLAGRLADLWGTRRLFMAALAIFVVGSALAGAAQDLDQLIGARVIQAIGGGVLVPVGTAAASHLFAGAARPRALGVIGALTFLGMAAGPVVGAAILGSVHADTALGTIGAGPHDLLTALLSPAWRWVFYLNVPIGLVALILAWAASAAWETPHHPGPPGSGSRSWPGWWA
jgi:MFS family permease